jgi:hypothetical protein
MDSLFTGADYIAKEYEIMTNITGEAGLLKVRCVSNRNNHNISNAWNII